MVFDLVCEVAQQVMDNRGFFGREPPHVVEQAGHRAAALQHFDDFIAHRFVVAAQYRWPAGLQEIDILIFIGIP